jgi:hypothetical protein
MRVSPRLFPMVVHAVSRTVLLWSGGEEGGHHTDSGVRSMGRRGGDGHVSHSNLK